MLSPRGFELQIWEALIAVCPFGSRLALRLVSDQASAAGRVDAGQRRRMGRDLQGRGGQFRRERLRLVNSLGGPSCKRQSHCGGIHGSLMENPGYRTYRFVQSPNTLKQMHGEREGRQSSSIMRLGLRRPRTMSSSASKFPLSRAAAIDVHLGPGKRMTFATRLRDIVRAAKLNDIVPFRAR
jgi:hypothetical protein